MAGQHRDLMKALLDREGRSFADAAGVRLKDTPQPLYQLLVLAMLLSARISSDIAVRSARELFRAGYRSAGAMANASWQDRVDALGRGGYRRYDERTSTMLGNGAEQVRDTYRGDLRRLRKQADGDLRELRRLLQQVPGIAEVGANIFCREAQAVWPELRPFIDTKATDGAKLLGLPSRAEDLAKLVDADDLHRLAAALVRVALDKNLATTVREAA